MRFSIFIRNRSKICRSITTLKEKFTVANKLDIVEEYASRKRFRTSEKKLQVSF